MFDISKGINHQVVALESVFKEIEPAIVRYVNKKGIVFKKEIEEDVLILGSLEYLQAICRNVLENAIKYSHKGGVVLLHVEIKKETILISIHDEGDGFAPHVLSAFKQDKWGVTHDGNSWGKRSWDWTVCNEKISSSTKGVLLILSQTNRWEP